MTWVAIRVFLGGAWGRLRPLLARYWREAAMILMALLSWHQRAQIAACHVFRAEVRAASKQAAAAQQAVNHAPAAASQAIARKSDAQAPAYYRAAHAAADAHRVRADGAGRPDTAGVLGADHAAQVDDRPAAAAELVCRPKADDDLIVDAAARAAQMHVDAEALIAAGAAVTAEPNP